MKKVLTLALALVLALSLAVPALAFWGNPPSTATNGGVTVDIYLVDHDGSGSLLAGLLSLPATNRGYAKNEIVAAIASVMIPANTNIINMGYRQLRLTGTNVSVNVADNYAAGLGALALNNTFAAAIAPTMNAANNRIEIGMTAAVTPVVTSAATYRVLYFAKVTGDKACMTVTLTKTLAFAATPPSSMPLGADYMVTNTAANVYVIGEVDAAGTAIAKPLFIIRTNASGKAESIEATPDSVTLANIANANWFGVTGGAGAYTYLLSGVGARIPTGAEALVLNSRMADIFTTALGLDLSKRAYSMTNDDWASYANSFGNLTESVDIEPWTPYVTVPDNIVIDPPKTGDAASILGFVMIVLAGAAVVAVKKVRA